MPTIFSGINLALRALMAHQQAQTVTAHNVANANTPGYTRQEAVLAADHPYTPAAFNRPQMALQLGMGAYVAGVRRFNLEFFDGRLRTELAAQSGWSERQAILGQVESLLPETGGAGVSDRLDDFWSAWHTLSTDPASLAARAAVVNSGDRLAATLRDRYTTLTVTRRDEDARVAALVGEVNQEAADVARLNEQIMRAVGAGDNPNDLLDRRDVLLDELAGLTGAVVHFQANGDALVSVGGHLLVTAGRPQTLSVTADAANPGMSKVVWDDGDASFSAGKIAGAIASRDTDLPARLTALDALAGQLRSQVNTLHSASFGLPPANATGLAFFTGSGAEDLGVSASLAADPAQLGAAAAADSPGDGSRALAVAQLSNALLMSGGARTLNDYWADAITQVGLDTRRAGAEADTHALIRDALQAQKESVSGVSLDEEAARLAQSQRAYEAAARVLTAFDELADTVINRMGVVGR